MKKLMLIAILALTVQSCGTMIKIDSSIDNVVENVILTTDKNDNFVRANEWMVESFKDAESVIQFADKEGGIVKGKYLLKSGHSYFDDKSYYAIITIRVKDGASRIEIEPLDKTLHARHYKGYEGTIYANSTVGYTKEMYDASVKLLIESFKSRMQSSNIDW